MDIYNKTKTIKNKLTSIIIVRIKKPRSVERGKISVSEFFYGLDINPTYNSSGQESTVLLLNI